MRLVRGTRQGKGDSHRAGPNCATRPGVLAGNPYERPERGPRFGPTLCEFSFGKRSSSTTSATVRARLGRLNTLGVFHSKSISYGGFVWAHRGLKNQNRRFLARAVQYAALGKLCAALAAVFRA